MVAMYMQEGGLEVERLSSRPALVAAIGLAALATILIGVYPQPYIVSAANAFHSPAARKDSTPPQRSTSDLSPLPPGEGDRNHCCYLRRAGFFEAGFFADSSAA